MPAQSHVLDCNFVSVPCRTAAVCVFLYGKVKHQFKIQHFTQCKFQSAEVPKVWSRGHRGTAQETSTSLCRILKMLPPIQGLKSSLSHPTEPHISIQLASHAVNDLDMPLKRPTIKQQWQENA